MNPITNVQESLAKDLVEIEQVLDNQNLEQVEAVYQKVYDILHDIKVNL
jgi:hypothetical protein